jgi:hypothetical protein
MSDNSLELLHLKDGAVRCLGLHIAFLRLAIALVQVRLPLSMRATIKAALLLCGWRQLKQLCSIL